MEELSAFVVATRKGEGQLVCRFWKICQELKLAFLFHSKLRSVGSGRIDSFLSRCCRTGWILVLWENGSSRQFPIGASGASVICSQSGGGTPFFAQEITLLTKNTAKSAGATMMTWCEAFLHC